MSAVVFRYGVASFDPTSDGVLLWTHALPGTQLRYVVATDSGLVEVVGHGQARAEQDGGHVVVDVRGLDAATTYFYAFEADGVRSPVGRTRTLPSGHVDRFRIGVVSCARYVSAPLGVYRALADHDVDLVLHVGDYIYETDGARGQDEAELRPAVTVEDYDGRYATVRSDPDCIALHLRHPVVTVWDDGDLCDLAATDGAPSHDPEKNGPWEARVRAALTARARWLPSRHVDPTHPRDWWGSVVIGDVAELLLLDTRLAGRDVQAGEPDAKPLHDPTRSLLGAAQRRWASERLRDDTVTWAVPVSAVVVNEIVLPLPAPSAANDKLPPGYAYLDGKVMHDDQWDGYPAERDGLARALRARHEHGRPSLLLSGDVHASWAFEGPLDPDTGDPVSVEFTVPAVSSPTMEQTVAPGSRGLGRVVRRAVQQLPHVRYADLVHHGYGVLELTHDRAAMTWWHVDPYAQEPGRQRRLGAALAVDADSWPPSLYDVIDEVRNEHRHTPPPVLTNPVPPRPVDLPELRRARDRRRRRMTAALSVAVALGIGVVGYVARRVATRR